MLRQERAIEGLPVRLVIALVIGAATMSIMLNMLSGVEGLVVTELDVRPEPDVIEPGPQELELTVIDPSGSAVGDAMVVVTPGTAELNEVITARAGADGIAQVEVNPQLRPNQATGTLEVTIKPPSGGSFVDQRTNTEVLVINR
mgnify:CR=1 FL=1|jgi:hypothetical protein